MDINDEVVIIGAGISGLATALALHRKGIKTLVIERSESLRNTTGSAIGIRQNGWRALHQLGIAQTLRHTAIPIQRERIVSLADGKVEEIPMEGETRCLRRKDLIETLYDALPPATVKFGCQLESIKLDQITTKPVLRFIDGSSIIAKVVIGCDGGKSIIADFLNLKPTKMFSFCGVRGLSNYPNGHSFTHEFLRIHGDNKLVGRVPIDDHLVYWFCSLPYVPGGQFHIIFLRLYSLSFCDTAKTSFQKSGLGERTNVSPYIKVKGSRNSQTFVLLLGLLGIYFVDTAGSHGPDLLAWEVLFESM